MVKKLFAMLLLLSLFLPAAALADAQVIDDANLLSPTEEQKIAEIINRIEKNHQVDLVILTTYDVPDDYSESMHRLRDYADEYYERNGFGMGADFSGMLCLLDMNNRVIWLSTGGVMIDYITDSREEDIIDAGYNELGSGDYGRALYRMVEQTEYFMNKGREEGTFRYDEVTGERLSGLYNALTSAELMVALIAGITTAAVFVLTVSASYNLKGKTYSYDRGANSNIVLTKDVDQFLRETVTRTARASSSGNGSSGSSSSSGGSGVHTSSSGTSHGGGGRRF